MARSRRLTSEDDRLTRIAWLIALIISIALLGFSRRDSAPPSAISGLTTDAVSPLVSLLSRPLRAGESLGNSVSERSRVQEENIALRAELDRLRERQSRYDLLRMKVDRYEQIIGADTGSAAPLEKIVARAVGETNGPFVRSLLINKGTDAGVRNGNPVLSPEGLVGHVINAGRTSSRVLRLDDLNSRIAVMSARSNATAILSGDNTDKPKLAYINMRRNWAVGDRVVTSGDDGALPRGLAVGVVMLADDGEFRVELSADAAAADWVWVSPYQPIAPPIETDPLSDEADDATAEVSP